MKRPRKNLQKQKNKKKKKDVTKKQNHLKTESKNNRGQTTSLAYNIRKGKKTSDDRPDQ